MADLTFRIDGLNETRKALREAEDPKRWGKELARLNREMSSKVTDWSAATARGMGGQQAHFAGALKARATQTQGRVEVGGPRTPKGKARANPAFWGRKSQGNWIGTSWDVGDSSGGPYAINETIARRKVEIDTLQRGVIDRVLGDAFGRD